MKRKNRKIHGIKFQKKQLKIVLLNSIYYTMFMMLN